MSHGHSQNDCFEVQKWQWMGVEIYNAGYEFWPIPFIQSGPSRDVSFFSLRRVGDHYAYIRLLMHGQCALDRWPNYALQYTLSVLLGWGGHHPIFPYAQNLRSWILVEKWPHFLEASWSCSIVFSSIGDRFCRFKKQYELRSYIILVE